MHAEDKAGGSSNKIIVIIDETFVTRDDLEHRVMEAMRYKEEDRLQREKAAGVHNLFVHRSARAHYLQPPAQRLVELSCMQLWSVIARSVRCSCAAAARCLCWPSA